MSLLTADELNLINTDSKYKGYVSSIEKSLKNFESSTEWADLIASLGKLKKVIQNYPKYAYIPKRLQVSKRLAQCMHPALPSGVHLKALEVYTIIFQNIGQENLSKDLVLYANGLFPLLGSAALNVKPVLLNIYETYFLPLKRLLRPCLIGLLLAILPGLEEGSDFYARSFNLLKNICISQSAPTLASNPTSTLADDKYFYSCLWSAIISQSSIRFPAIQFILTNYETYKKATASSNVSKDTTAAALAANHASSDKKSNPIVDDQLYLIGNSIDLMINGICVCLQDSNPLVQRNILDFVCYCLPMDTQEITRDDKLQLIVVAIHVILRRDMSLNRRFYAWLTGSSNTNSTMTINTSSSNSKASATSGAQDKHNKTDAISESTRRLKSLKVQNFFNTHSKSLLINAIKLLLNHNETLTKDITTTATMTTTTTTTTTTPKQQILYLEIDDSYLTTPATTNIVSGASSSAAAAAAAAAAAVAVSGNVAAANSGIDPNLGSLQYSSSLAAATAPINAKNLLNNVNQTSTTISTNSTLKIIKILSNLIEKQEIGQAIVHEILLDLLYHVYKECSRIVHLCKSYKSKNQLINFNNQTHSISYGFDARKLNHLHMTTTQFSSSNTTNSTTSAYLNTMHQLQLRELNELKKAACNFLFQSFELQFVFEFLSSNFENLFEQKYSKSTSGAVSALTISQLCDLYEFIFDLLTSADIFNDLQSEYFPYMLKNIIKTLNKHCAAMSNQDLSKSLILCLSILRKVVPKVMMPTNTPAGAAGVETVASNRAKISPTKTSNSIKKSTVDSKQKTQAPTVIEKPQQQQTDNKTTDCTVSSTSVEEVVAETLNNLITLIENGEESKLNELLLINQDLNNSETEVKKLYVNMSSVDSEEKLDPIDFGTNNLENDPNNQMNDDEYEEKNQEDEYLIEYSIYYLKELTHKFIRSHLFDFDKLEESFLSNRNESMTADDIQLAYEDDQIGSSFDNLFDQNSQQQQSAHHHFNPDFSDSFESYSSSIDRLDDADDNGDIQLLNEYDMVLKSSRMKIVRLKEETHNNINNNNGQKSAMMSSSGVESFETNYLQSFRLLNKLLTKIFLYPQHKIISSSTNVKSSSESLTNEERGFESWLKDLIVMCCSSYFKVIVDSDNNKPMLDKASKFLMQQTNCGVVDDTNTKRIELLFEYRTIALNTLLELINISESINQEQDNDLKNQKFASVIETYMGESITSGSFKQFYNCLPDSQKERYADYLKSLNMMCERESSPTDIDQFRSANKSRANESGKYLIKSVLSRTQIETLLKRSKFGYLCANMLWSYMKPMNVDKSLQNDSVLNRPGLAVSLDNYSLIDKRASILFCLLNEILPSNTCEDLIAGKLLALTKFSLRASNNYEFNFGRFDGYLIDRAIFNRVDAFHRFMKLWHWSRSLCIDKSRYLNSGLGAVDDTPNESDDIVYATTNTFGKQTKAFERSLFILFDLLNSKETPKVLVNKIEEWILKCITEYNDLSRLLDILLVGLLDPLTARVSIQSLISGETLLSPNYLASNVNNISVLNSDEQHQDLESLLSSKDYNYPKTVRTKLLTSFLKSFDNTKPLNKSELDYEAKVYAISNEGGNVIYHVNNQQQQVPSQPNLLQPSSASKKASSLTNIAKSSHATTSNELSLSILNAASLANQGRTPYKEQNDYFYSPSVATPSNPSISLNQSESHYDEKLTDNDSAIFDQTDHSSLQKQKMLPGQTKTLNRKSLTPLMRTAATPGSQSTGAKEVAESSSTSRRSFKSDRNSLVSLNPVKSFESDYETKTQTDVSFDIYTTNEESRSIEENSAIMRSGNNNNKASTESMDRIKDSNLDSFDLLKRSAKTRSLQPNAIKSHAYKYSNKSALGAKKATSHESIHTVDLTSNYVDSNHAHLLVYYNCSNVSIELVQSKFKSSSSTATSTTTTTSSGQQQSQQPNENSSAGENQVIMNKLKIQTVNSLAFNDLSVNTYDHKRILFLLKCLEKLFSKCKNEFLIASSKLYIQSNHKSNNMSGTSQSSRPLDKQPIPFSVYNEKLIDLLIRHLKSMYGKNFYSNQYQDRNMPDSNEFNLTRFDINNMTYLEVIINVLLFYIRSYYLPTRFALVKKIDTSMQMDGSNLHKQHIRKASKSSINLNRELSPPGFQSPLSSSVSSIDLDDDCNLIDSATNSKKSLRTLGEGIGNKKSRSTNNLSMNTTIKEETSTTTAGESKVRLRLSKSSTSINQSFGDSNEEVFNSSDQFKRISYDEEAIESQKKSSSNRNSMREKKSEKMAQKVAECQFANQRDNHIYIENRNIQIYCLQMLKGFVRGLIDLCQSPSPYDTRAFNHLKIQKCVDVMNRCKLQKTLLMCFHSNINAPHATSLTHCVLLLNNIHSNRSANKRNQSSSTTKNTADSDAYQLRDRNQTDYRFVCELISALESVIRLEKIIHDYQVAQKIQAGIVVSGLNAQTASNKLDEENINDHLLLTLNKQVHSRKGSISGGGRLNTNIIHFNATNPTPRYIINQSICNQSMYISTVLHYLKNLNLVEYHLPILDLIKNSLPASGNALKSLSTFVVEQLCRNLLQITNQTMSSLLNVSSSLSNSQFLLGSSIDSQMNQSSTPTFDNTIPDLMILFIKELTYLLHFGLIGDSTKLTSFTANVLSNVFVNEFSLSSSSSSSLLSSGATPLSNVNILEQQMKIYRQFLSEQETNLNQAKESLINLLPSILSSICHVWQRSNVLLTLLEDVSIETNNHLHGSNATINKQQLNNSLIMGDPELIKQCITEMLVPIAENHSQALLTAIANVWGEKRKRTRTVQYLTLNEHQTLLEMVGSLKSFTISVMLTNIVDLLKQNTKDKKKSPINVWILQFLHSYLDYYYQTYFLKQKRAADSRQTSRLNSAVYSDYDMATCLVSFFKECLLTSLVSSLLPLCCFQLFKILFDSINNFPILVDERKFSKDVQDITHKLFELCNSIVASSLQQTTWLRKNYAVKLSPAPTPTNLSGTPINQSVTTSSMPALMNGSSTDLIKPSATATTSSILPDNASNVSSATAPMLTSSNTNESISNAITPTSTSTTTGSGSTANSSLKLNTSTVEVPTHLNIIENNHFDMSGMNMETNSSYSLQALNILGEYLPKTFDIVYKSDEKERLVVPLLINLMSNLWPYLKTHSIANRNNFRAASYLLMNLTNYPYTRKTWKKEVFDLLFESSYFHVDSLTLDYSRVIIDNLISNDRAMFKEVLTKVTYQQSGGLFSSKEQESEQKAQLLKRLAFVIYSSERDQYQKNMPEIQECIAHILKIMLSSNVYSALFLLFRILLLRISSRHLISLWPTILSELIVILLQLEQELNDDLDNRSLRSNQSFSSSLSAAGAFNSNQLTVTSNSSSSSMIINLDHNTLTTVSNVITASPSSKLQIYLSACKLLDLILALPSSITAQFQYYKWSFVSDSSSTPATAPRPELFMPYLIRLSTLFRMRYQLLKPSASSHSGIEKPTSFGEDLGNSFKANNHNSSSSSSNNIKYSFGTGPLIRQRTINSLMDLRPFFECISTNLSINCSLHTKQQQQILLHNQQQQQQQYLSPFQPQPPAFQNANSFLKPFESSVHEDFFGGLDRIDSTSTPTQLIK